MSNYQALLYSKTKLESDVGAYHATLERTAKAEMKFH